MEKLSKFIDLLFKLVIIIAIIFLLKDSINNSEVGRYQAFTYYDLANILDTKTGDIYTGDYGLFGGFVVGRKIHFVEKIDSLKK